MCVSHVSMVAAYMMPVCVVLFMCIHQLCKLMMAKRAWVQVTTNPRRTVSTGPQVKKGRVANQNRDSTWDLLLFELFYTHTTITHMSSHKRHSVIQFRNKQRSKNSSFSTPLRGTRNDSLQHQLC